MKARAIIAIIVCKLLRLLSRILHRGGTAMPGRFALKICPELLSIVSAGVKTVAITGTNGKTTSARMVEQAFAEQGKSYFANRSGANLISGITTEFVINSSLSGKCRKEYAVIECDEAAAKRVFAQMKPKVVVVTNLFQDQVDRFGDVTNTLESIRTAIKNIPDARLCLNADCSLTASLAGDLPNEAVYFGIEQGAVPSPAEPDVSDAANCIRCGAEYTYDYISYGHLGGFRCPRCGYSRHRADYAVTSVVSQGMDSSEIVMDIRGDKRIVTVNLPAMYNIYNAIGAVAAVTEMGLGADAAIAALADCQCGFGRMERFELGKGGARMVLVKNTAGCNQVIEFLKNVKEKFSLVICINNRPSDGTDISWLADTNFEALGQLSGYLERIRVSGDRADEMAERLRTAGIGGEFISIERDYEKLVQWMEQQEKPVFIMPTYTAMLDLRQVIIAHCGGDDFWA